jgi:hypothetical protein
MKNYTPEIISMALASLKNIVLICACAWTTVELYKLSGSWWSLLALLMLMFLSGMKFIRD